jgi:ELWxxDGT repeat protein
MKKLTLLSFLLICIQSFSQNPQLLKEVVPGNNNGTIQQIVKTSNYTFFNQNDGGAASDRSLFRTDGTPAGTIKLNLTYPGYISTKADKLTAFGSKIVFAGDNFTNYGEIWTSDGTQAGTVAIERFQPINNKVPVVEINTMGNYAYYSVINKDAGGINRAYLRRTDGTAAGTSEVYDFSAFTGIPQVVFLTPMNGTLYFIVYDANGTGYDQLWRSDGTTAGTYMIYNFGSTQFVGSYLMVAGNNFYIMLGTPGVGNVLWKSDGTAAGTAPVKTIHSTMGGNYYPQFVAIGNNLVFAGLDGNGMELWVTDGTSTGTNMVANINPGAANSNPANFRLLNNTLYFSATSAASGNELWKSDGTVSGTTIVKDINPGVGNSNPSWFSLSGNTILFNANNGVTGGELWITDGTTANTVQATDMNPGAGGASPNLLTPGNPVFFAANNGVSGFEVFKYDNTDGIAGLHKIYVNDGNQAGDIFTTATGSNTNPGTRTAPVANVQYAVSIAQPGDTIIVDAGTFTEQVTIDKEITIKGAGQNLTSIVKPAVTTAPPGSFPEQGVIQTSQSITGDVHISNLSVTGDYTVNVTPIIIQSGGSVKNCKLQSGNQGIFVRIDPVINLATKTFVVDGNTINAEYIAVNFAGTRLTGTLSNNTLATFNPGFSTGVFAGLDFGTLAGLTVTGNTFSSYVSDGMMVNANNCTITLNSFLGTGSKAINKIGGSTINATCNWYGSPLASVVATKVNSGVTYAPWLVDGSDNSPSTGFQTSATCPVANSYYVNDNSQAGDVFTTAVGNNANPGTPTAPFATVDYAISLVPDGATIFVDAGDYPLASELIISKKLTILGANYLVSPNNSTNKTEYNTARNTETRFTGSRFALSSDDITIKGLRFSSNGSALGTVNNTNLKNIVLDKNSFDVVTGGGPTVNLSATAFNPTTAINYTITDNRFNRIDLSTSPLLDINGLKDVLIDNNVFIESAASTNRGTAIRTSAGRIVENINVTNNYFKKVNNGIQTFILKNAMIQNNVFDSCSQGFFMTPNTHPGPLGSSDITISQNLFKDLRIGRSVLIRSGEYGLSNFTISNNTINQSVNGINGIVSLIQLEYINTSATQIITNSTFGNTQVLNNVINISGDYLQSIAGSNNAIQLTGNHSNTTIAGNELNFTAINATSPAIAGIFPPVPTGIYLRTDGGAGYGTIPASAIVNISNNKINGFKSSIGIYDPTAAGTTANVGYGFLTTGTTVNISNNSISGDSMSIDNGIVSQSVNATCNWFGSNVEESINSKISLATVNHVPWLSNGTDNDVATGFQPVANSCNGYPRKLYVNDNSRTGDVFTTAVGNNANLGTPAAPFATIDYAYNIAEPGDTIYVDAGVYGYGGELFIQKGITFIGCNYNTSPNDATNAVNANSSWVAESKITGGTLTILSNNITFKGFTFDPGLRTAVSLNNSTTSNNNFGNLKFENNRFIITQTSSQVILVGVGNGSTQPSGLINSGFTITNNRFEKSAAGGGAVFSVHLVKNVTINNNAFVIGTGGAIRTATAVSMGNVGVVDQVTISNNTIDRFGTFVTGNQYANASIVQNKVFNTTTSMNISNSMLGVSNIDYSNNILNGNSGIMPFSQYVRTGGNGVGSSTLFKAENNQVSVTAAPVTTTILGAFIIQYGNSVQNQSVIIRGNSITMAGDVSTVEGQFVRPITIRGNLGNAIVENNEISFSAVNLQPKNPLNVLPVCPAITLSPENGATAVLQPSSVVNIRNNKVHGFKHSFVVFDLSAGANPYIGFGNLPFGATVNVNDNSFTGDSMSINHSNVGEVVNATCNWFGSAAAQNFISKLPLSANLDILPWLTNGTDNDAATGFQPVPNSCDGYPTLITLNGSSNVTCNGANNGSISITASYGRAPFTYTWTKDGDPGFISHDEDPTGLAPGTYRLAILDGNGSTIYITDPEADGPGTIVVTITEPSILTASADGTNNLCNGQSNGTASVIAGGGTAPYTYLWSNGGTTSSVSNLAAGTYNVTVTDANGCTANASYQVTQPSVLTATGSGTNVSCFGGSNGTATVTVGGGTSAYSYLWSNGGTTQTISGLTIGTYNVTVTDANGCTANASYQVTQPALLTATGGGTNVSCFGGSNGTATVTAGGGTSAYSYLWSNGGTTQTISGLTIGTYNVTVTDANGCTANAFYQVTQPSLLTAVASGTSTPCANTATVEASGGTAPYSYEWSNGATTQSITSIPSGTYNVTVTDNKGCTVNTSVTVTANEAFNPSATVTDVACFGGNNGSITVTNANGVAPFQYSRDGGLTYQSSNVFGGLVAGTYTITVKDVNGCTGFVTKDVTQPAQLLVTPGSIQSTCSGQSTGSISVNVTGGSGNLNYSWTGPGGYTSTQKNNTGLAAGNYSLTVVDANGCHASLNVTVAVYSQINVAANITNVLCNGGSTGSIDLTVTGGTNSGFTYLWNNGATTEDRFNLPAGNNYRVTITDIGSGCTVTRRDTIREPVSAVSVTVPNQNITNVTGCNSPGSFTAQGSGGTAFPNPNQYRYSLNGVTYQTSPTFTNLVAGNYIVTIKDANGCTATRAVSITDNGSDEYESAPYNTGNTNNNNKSKAAPISPGVVVSARIGAAGDVDFYKLGTLNTWSGNYSISLVQPSPAVTYYLMKSNGTSIQPASDSTAAFKNYTGLSGNYFVKVSGANSLNCYQFTVINNVITKSAGTSIQAEVVKARPAKDIFDIRVLGNPSSTGFILNAVTSSDMTMRMRVFDAQGRLLEEKQNIQPSEIIRIGSGYINGIYLAEFIQGKNRKTVRLIKM